MTSQCCGYGPGLSLSANGFDCVMIPGATKAADKADLNNGGAYGFCGGTLATINNMAIAATVCSKLFLTFFQEGRLLYQNYNSTYILVKHIFMFPFPAMQVPFSLRFLSDHYEFDNEKANNPVGFRLTYMSQTCQVFNERIKLDQCSKGFNYNKQSQRYEEFIPAPYYQN